ncbi:hypothetical protein CEE34_02945 [Candidatus Aerophobetes bacterium Ae_b3a]|nr:MAG: hypothetical protein CEE34_02945 [Candidatus Aerophobetes bacterium Ae_b3a]
MSPSPMLIDRIDCLDDTFIDIRESNDSSPIIKRVRELIDSSSKERFYDFLLEDYDALKLMTNALIDVKKTDETTPIFLFSSEFEKDPDDGRKSREEFSMQCKYQLDPKMRAISTMIQPYQQMLTSEITQSDSTQELQLMQEERKEMIFCLNNFYGYSLDAQIGQGFSDRTQLISLSDISCKVYEDLIAKFLQIGIASVLQHICWCKNHSTVPYAILILGSDEIGDVKCPVCKEPLYSGRFISLNPEFEPLIKSFGGFLPLLIGWCLTKKGIEWTADVKIENQEYGDIIFKYDGKYCLVECKIWSRNKNNRGIENCIEKALEQAVKHMKYWEGCKVNIKRTDILTNELDNEILKKELRKAMNNRAQEIAGRRIRVHPIKSIPTFIFELRD